MKRFFCLAPIMAIFFMLAAKPADAFPFVLDGWNEALSGYTGPFAKVTVDLTDATHATITFESKVKEENIYLFGDGSAVAVNVNATSWTLGSISGSNTAGTGFTPGSFSDGGAGNVDGFGSFNQRVNDFDGFSHSANFIQFTVTNTSGTWTSDMDVLVANEAGNRAAAHIFVTSYTTGKADASNGALVTGYASENPIPEPSTLFLLGSGLAVLALWRRKRL